jgi:hypothetical protein
MEYGSFSLQPGAVQEVRIPPIASCASVTQSGVPERYSLQSVTTSPIRLHLVFAGMATIEKPTDDLLNSLAYVLSKNLPCCEGWRESRSMFRAMNTVRRSLGDRASI